MAKSGFLRELRRRHIGRVAIAYAAVGWVVLQLATMMFPTFGAPAWVLKVFVSLLALGFPIALVFGWAFEMTPEGIRRTVPPHSPAALPPEQTYRIGRALNSTIMGVLAIAVGVLLWREFISQRVVQSPLRPAITGILPAVESIAVLPLLNESEDPHQDYFSDGLSEELISTLSQVRGLRVISRNSSFQFRGTGQNDGAGIARKLGVTTLLEGTVRKQGDQVRIFASLINAADGSTLWSQTYDRELKDIFAVQSEIAQSVASALKTTLLGDARGHGEQPPGGSLAAYNALLEGNFDLARRSEGDVRKAIGFYDEAIRLEPRYALAYAKRSYAWRTLAGQFLSGQQAADAATSARDDARTALVLQPDLAAAHVALGFVLKDADFDFAAAEIEFRRAVALAPADADAKDGLAVLLADLGRFDEAIHLTLQALVLDPLHGSWYLNVASNLISLGRFDQAEQTVRKAIALQPRAAVNYMLLAIVEIKRGNPEAALLAAQQESAEAWRDYALALVQQARGDRAAADAALRSLIDRHAVEAPFQIASVYAFRKQPDQAFEWLERAWAARDPGVTELLGDPFLRAYQDDPRFSAFCKKIGLPAPASTIPSGAP